MAKELLGGLELNRIYQRDCLEGSLLIERESVDLILTDLPYGNMNTDGGRKLGINGWDHAIEPAKVFEIANRILRKNGKMVLFSQEPYTTELIKNAIPNIPFSYRAIWEKDNFANALGVNKAMVSLYEDVLVFSKSHPKHDFEGAHPLREYFKKMREFISIPTKKINEVLGNQMSSHYFTNGSQFAIPTKIMYEKLISNFRINEMVGFMEFESVKQIDTEYRQNLIKDMNGRYPSTFNLWEGNKYKSNILKYKKDYDGFHPTQKPIMLLEDLIKTFSNQDDLVVDLTCGSGSTCVAASRTGRKFIGFETETKYVEIANKRLDNEREDA